MFGCSIGNCPGNLQNAFESPIKKNGFRSTVLDVFETLKNGKQKALRKRMGNAMHVYGPMQDAQEMSNSSCASNFPIGLPVCHYPKKQKQAKRNPRTPQLGTKSLSLTSNSLGNQSPAIVAFWPSESCRTLVYILSGQGFHWILISKKEVQCCKVPLLPHFVWACMCANQPWTKGARLALSEPPAEDDRLNHEQRGPSQSRPGWYRLKPFPGKQSKLQLVADVMHIRAYILRNYMWGIGAEASIITNTYIYIYT